MKGSKVFNTENKKLRIAIDYIFKNPNKNFLTISL